MFNSIFFGGLFSGFENEKFYRSDRTVDKHFHGPYNRGTFMESEVESMDAGGSNGTLAGRSFPATDEPPQGVRRFRMSIE